MTFQAYWVKATSEGIYDMNSACSPYDHLLVPDDGVFAILRLFDLYSFISGPQMFVETALGSSIETGQDAFMEFATKPQWADVDRSRLVDLATKCKAFNSRIATLN